MTASRTPPVMVLGTHSSVHGLSQRRTGSGKKARGMALEKRPQQSGQHTGGQKLTDGISSRYSLHPGDLQGIWSLHRLADHRQHAVRREHLTDCARGRQRNSKCLRSKERESWQAPPSRNYLI